MELLLDLPWKMSTVLKIVLGAGASMEEHENELQRCMQVAEEHAYQVRQCIAQRERLFELFKLTGRLAEFSAVKGGVPAETEFNSTKTGDRRLDRVLSSIESSPSQFYQDIFCLLLAGGKSDGFFVEFGACDGVLISNSFLLEKNFGWKGILAEPSPAWHEKLRQNRDCIIETKCIWKASGEKLLFAEMENDNYLTQSGIVETSFLEDQSISKQYEVETISLFDALNKNNAPKHIDMLSVDTEGSELEILAPFPFDLYSFGFICVEHHQIEQETAIKSLLENAGYKQVLRKVSGHDGFYVPRKSPYF
jgi:FkbM family methyltransferase